MNTLITNSDSNDLFWKLPEEKWYRQDDLLNKYLEGLSDGYKKAQKSLERKLKKQLRNNIFIAQRVGENVFNKLNEIGIEVTVAYMKIEPLEKFKIIFKVKKEDFYSDKIIEGYKVFSEFQKDFMSENIYVDLSFLPAKGRINNECLISDGFIFHYDEKKS
jgi:hypothetical protein